MHIGIYGYLYPAFPKSMQNWNNMKTFLATTDNYVAIIFSKTASQSSFILPCLLNYTYFGGCTISEVCVR